MISSMMMVFAVNRILLSAGGEAVVAAFSIVNTIMNANLTLIQKEPE